MFVTALDNAGSDSPLFLLFTLSDAKLGSRKVATDAAHLIGAIQLERGFPFDESGRQAASQFAQDHWAEPFAFANAAARENVAPLYSVREVNRVRRALSRFSQSDLSAQLNELSTQVHRLYTGPRCHDREACLAAVAHVLLERGLLVGEQHQTGLLYQSGQK